MNYYFIYKLIKNKDVVYVGCTSKSMRKREQYNWPVEYDKFEIIEITSDVCRERYWQNHYKDTLLTNHNRPYTWTEDTKKKLSKATIGKIIHFTEKNILKKLNKKCPMCVQI